MEGNPVLDETGDLGSRISTRDVFLSMRRGVGWIAGDVAITWE